MTVHSSTSDSATNDSTHSTVPASIRVVEAVAAADGVDPTDLEPPLYDVIDPSALDVLFAPTSRTNGVRSGRVSFEYRGHVVTVRSDGEVALG